MQNAESRRSSQNNEVSTFMSQTVPRAKLKYSLGNTNNQLEMNDKTLGSSLKSILDSQIREKQMRNLPGPKYDTHNPRHKKTISEMAVNG